jgi:hypothetical protein
MSGRLAGGYLAAALQRPVSWRRDAPHMPTPGARCSTCKGTRWWSGDKREWGCMSCLPPPASAGTLHTADAARKAA